jgi:hypothetical protein
LTRAISGLLFTAGPVNFLWVLGAPATGHPNRAFAGTLGSFGTPSRSDALNAFDLVTGLATPFGTSGAFNLGRPALAGARLLVPDALASTPRIHVYDVTGTGVPAETSAFVADTVNGLPPREIAAY